MFAQNDIQPRDEINIEFCAKGVLQFEEPVPFSMLLLEK